MNRGYGWYIRHARTGAYFRVDDETVHFDPRDATQFKTRDDARTYLMNPRARMLPLCDVVDATIQEPLTPDAEPLQLPSFEEALAAARAKRAGEKFHGGGGCDLSDTPPPPGPAPVVMETSSAYGVGGYGNPPSPLFSGRPVQPRGIR